MSENYVVTGPCKITCVGFGLLAAAIAAYLLGQMTGPVVAGLLAILVFFVATWLLHKIFCGKQVAPVSTGEMAATTVGSAAASVAATNALAGDGATKSEARKKSTPNKAKPKAAAAKPAPKKAKAVTKTTAKKPAPKKSGPQRLKKPKGKADDLKRISGVGPKLEKTLNGLGFWHFSQIAEWKKADVAVVDDELSFKGRIERDEWIKQAKALAKEK